MSDEHVGVIHSHSEGGVAGAHPAVAALEVLAGPATSGESNAITTAIIPLACWRVEDIRFEFDSSFVRPEIAEEMKHLASLRDEHKKEVRPAIAGQPPLTIFPPLSVFGHADPTGDDDYNKGLSGRRAMSIYGMLTRDTDLWEELYSEPAGGDKWGVKAIQIMLAHSGFSRGEAGGRMDEQTREDVKRFQKVKGLTADGDPGPQTRAKLFLTYMDAVCGADFKLDKKDDFLARGADKGGKGDYQGCSEFNPVLLLSKKEEEEFSRPGRKPERDKENSLNRRVMVLLFRPGSRVSVSKWPCPRAKEGAGGCKKRFWSDGEKRRSSRLPTERRKYEKTRDTFACRFYHRFASRSPCESLGRRVQITFDDPFLGPFVGELRLKFVDGSIETMRTDEKGRAVIDASRSPYADAEYVHTGVSHSHRVFLLPPSVRSPEGMWQRLANMGFVPEEHPDPSPPSPERLFMAIEEFQIEHRMELTGVIDDATCDAVLHAHEKDHRDWQDREWADDPVVEPDDPRPKSRIT